MAIDGAHLDPPRKLVYSGHTITILNICDIQLHRAFLAQNIGLKALPPEIFRRHLEGCGNLFERNYQLTPLCATQISM